MEHPIHNAEEVALECVITRNSYETITSKTSSYLNNVTDMSVSFDFLFNGEFVGEFSKNRKGCYAQASFKNVSISIAGVQIMSYCIIKPEDPIFKDILDITQQTVTNGIDADGRMVEEFKTTVARLKVIFKMTQLLTKQDCDKILIGLNSISIIVDFVEAAVILKTYELRLSPPIVDVNMVSKKQQRRLAREQEKNRLKLLAERDNT